MKQRKIVDKRCSQTQWRMHITFVYNSHCILRMHTTFVHNSHCMLRVHTTFVHISHRLWRMHTTFVHNNYYMWLLRCLVIPTSFVHSSHVTTTLSCYLWLLYCLCYTKFYTQSPLNVMHAHRECNHASHTMTWPIFMRHACWCPCIKVVCMLMDLTTSESDFFNLKYG